MALFYNFERRVIDGCIEKQVLGIVGIGCATHQGIEFNFFLDECRQIR